MTKGASLLDIEYVHAGMVTYPPGASFGPRLLRDFEMVWIIQGQVKYHYNGACVEAPPGTIILAQPQFRDAFTWDPDRPTQHAYFHCAIRAFPDDCPPVTDWPVVLHPPDHDIIRPLFRFLLACTAQLTPHTPTAPTPMLRRTVEMLITAMVRGPVGQAIEHDREYPEPVRRALEYASESLDHDSARPIHLDQLAAAASVSPEHLCRLFRAKFDTSPVQAVRLIRLDLAVGLLARSNLSLKEIATRCGFVSPHHFSRSFAQVYGHPPSEIRRRVAEGHPPPISMLVTRMRLPVSDR